MNIQDKISKEARSLPETAAHEVLDFIAFLKTRISSRNQSRENEQADWSEFEKHAGVWTGRFDRTKSYDDPRFR